MNRPLSSKKIDELEELFEAWRQSPGQLRILLEELTHRSSKRAAALQAKVKRSMARLPNCAPAQHAPEQLRLPFDET